MEFQVGFMYLVQCIGSLNDERLSHQKETTSSHRHVCTGLRSTPSFSRSFSMHISVSFTEIYMERVRDLLDTSGGASQNLKVQQALPIVLRNI